MALTIGMSGRGVSHAHCNHRRGHGKTGVIRVFGRCCRARPGTADLRRDALIQWLPGIPAGTTVAMEACSGAHDYR